ncbi:bacterio-opsin activator domain-containing protein [Natronolimnohabitans sp. A-GB9]|uniref:bacterio-opsin activator domain-containing protein n=1 Tax=Natronolimnohabitans sp. A-GB9 TaxID=3069757 RepID=UPI0027B1F886|nr:bacterio-opsin activator domain-containing protein [Natronolimnohabitans sp. A-GB9]MDQ2052585.1 bacterio-opsin activator domain-containing protein [Natronolimnohabitans sp. A-GB9]
MSDGTATATGDVLRVLVVGDEPSSDAAMDALSSRLESVSLLRERSLSTALDRLAQLDVHCIVAPFDSETGDRTTLEQLHDRDETVPAVAVIDSTTDEQTITAALEAGAADVVDPEMPNVLVATRVRNTAERYRQEHTSDRRSRSILERSDALVWVTDANGRLEYASPAVESRMGYTPAELEGTPLARLVHPDDRETIGETLEDVSTAPLGATERQTLRLGHADGSWRAYELTVANRLADPVVEGIVLTLTDVATESDSLARNAVDRLSRPLFELGPQWELRYANEAASRLFDDEPSPGTVVWELLDDAVRGRFAERFREAKTTDRLVEFETSPPSLEDRFVVSVHPSEDGLTVTAREVSETDAAVDRERFDLLEDVVDALADGVVVLEESTVRFANPAVYELAETEPIVGRELDVVFDDDLAAAIRERAASPIVRWMEPVTGTLAGTEQRVDVFVTPLSATQTLCVVRDRSRSAAAALSTLEGAIAEIQAAESAAPVRRAVVDATLSCTDADLAAWYRPEGDALQPAAVETTTATDSVELPAIERDETTLFEHVETDTVGSGVALDRADLESVLDRLGVRAERVLAVPAADHGLVIATSTEPLAFGERDRLPVEAATGAAATALEGLEQTVAVRECRSALQRLETVVDRCTRLRETERAMLDAESRTEIERRLCMDLVDMPLEESVGTIELAWTGDVTSGSDRITADAWAGSNGDYLESISIPIERIDDATHPTAQAAATLEPVVVDDLERETSVEGDTEWRRRARERGFRSVVALPIAVGEFCYGTLTLYADRPSTFDDETRRACLHLATVAGHAIANLERKRALLSDSVTELEIELRDDDDPLSAIVHELDRQLDVAAVVPRSSGGSTVFCTVADVDDDVIRSAVDSVSELESARLVADRGTASMIEFVVEESTIATSLADHGGMLRSVLPSDDRTRLVVDLSSTVDVRSFVRAIERRQADASLLARRERDRSVQPARAFDAELRSQLSERQLRTLETAYYSGFFEWPRESTGEEVADSLGVSQPTFSRHLRLAQQKVYALLFDERNANSPETAE